MLTLAAIGMVIGILPMYVEAASETPIATSSTGSVYKIDSIRSGGYAGSIYATSSGHSFKEAWEATAYGDNASLTYGYNTFLINEDYSHAYHFKKEHSALVSNDNGTFESKTKPADEGASIEVRHKGSFIEYSNVWYD